MAETLVTIAKFHSLGEAKLAQGKLISEGISAFLCDEHMHAINWHMGGAFGGIRLQVPDRQMVRALEVLDGFEVEDFDSENDNDDEEFEIVPCCPECESLEIRQVGGNKPSQISLWSSAIPLPFPDPPTQTTHRWRCLACGYQWQEQEE